MFSHNQFTDEAGNTQHGVSVTIRVESSAIDIDALISSRRKWKASKIISKAIMKFIRDKNRRFDFKKAHGLNRINYMIDRIGKYDKKIKRHSKIAAKESHKQMLENDKLGDFCVVDKCFVFIGVEEKCLLLNALKQLVDLQRMVSILRISQQHKLC